MRLLAVSWRRGNLSGLRRNPIRLAALTLFLATLLLAGGYWLEQRLTHVEENDAQTQGEVATISSRVDGWLISRPVMEGDVVRQGQLLCELDRRDARLRLAQLQANLAALDAQIRQTAIQRTTTQQTVDAQVSTAQAQVSVANAAMTVTAHQADIANSDFARVDPLVAVGAVSQQSWEHAHNTKQQQQATLNQAQAQVAAQRASLAQASAQQGQVPMLGQQIKVLQNQRAAVAAQIAQVQQEIHDRSLRAPFNGIIDRTFIHVGDYVQTGQWLMMLHDPNNVWVEANIKETEVGRVAVGQAVDITVDAYPDLTLHGRVLKVGQAATNQFALLPSPNPSGNFTKITQRVPVRITIDHPPFVIPVGLMVEVSIHVTD
jgi:membrane fusion protein (multidrug efflux system)